MHGTELRAVTRLLLMCSLRGIFRRFGNDLPRECCRIAKLRRHRIFLIDARIIQILIIEAQRGGALILRKILAALARQSQQRAFECACEFTSRHHSHLPNARA